MGCTWRFVCKYVWKTRHCSHGEESELALRTGEVLRPVLFECVNYTLKEWLSSLAPFGRWVCSSGAEHFPGICNCRVQTLAPQKPNQAKPNQGYYTNPSSPASERRFCQVGWLLDYLNPIYLSFSRWVWLFRFTVNYWLVNRFYGDRFYTGE